MTQGDGSTRKREQLSYNMHKYASCDSSYIIRESKTQQQRWVTRSSFMHPMYIFIYCKREKNTRMYEWPNGEDVRRGGLDGRPMHLNQIGIFNKWERQTQLYMNGRRGGLDGRHMQVTLP